MSRCVVAGIKRACGQRPDIALSAFGRTGRIQSINGRRWSSTLRNLHRALPLSRAASSCATKRWMQPEEQDCVGRPIAGDVVHTLGGKHAKTSRSPPKWSPAVLVGCKGFHGSLPDV